MERRALAGWLHHTGACGRSGTITCHKQSLESIFKGRASRDYKTISINLSALRTVHWARMCKRLRSPGIDSFLGGPVRQIGLSYRTARLHRLAESIPWNRFLGSLFVYKFGLLARICKRLWSPSYVSWRAGTTNKVVVPAQQAGDRFLGSLEGLQIRALVPLRLCRKQKKCQNSWSRIIGRPVEVFARYCPLPGPTHQGRENNLKKVPRSILVLKRKKKKEPFFKKISWKNSFYPLEISLCTYLCIFWNEISVFFRVRCS